MPGIAWHSLETSLYENETMKAGWAGLLQSVAGSADLDPHIESAYEAGQAGGTISDEDREWFRSRGPGDRIDEVDVPTLFLQGTVDTLFPLDEAIANYESLRTGHVPTAMLWFCGGHGACLTDAGDPDRTTDASFAWLARYLKGDGSVDTGPEFSLVDQEGTEWTATSYPNEADETLSGSGTGTLELTDASAAGPVAIPPGSGDELAALVAPITPGPATDAIQVDVATGSVDAQWRWVRLQLTATNVTWAHGVLGGAVDLTEVRANIPVVTEGLTQS